MRNKRGGDEALYIDGLYGRELAGRINGFVLRLDMRRGVSIAQALAIPEIKALVEGLEARTTPSHTPKDGK